MKNKKTVKAFVLPLIVLSILCASQVIAQGNVMLKGDVKNLDGHPLAISYISNGERAWDSISAPDGHFEASLPISQLQEIKIHGYRLHKYAVKKVNSKFYNQLPEFTIFASPGDTITILGNAKHLWAANVEGTQWRKATDAFKVHWIQLENKAYALQKQQLAAFNLKDSLLYKKAVTAYLENERAKRNYKEAFIKNNTTNLYALYLFSKSLPSMQPQEIEQLFSTYTAPLRQSFYGKKISAFIAKNKSVGIGKSMIDFVGTTLKGETFSTKNLRAKYMLLDFWGSWCNPCRKSHPHLKKLYNEYHSKGLEIVGIAQQISASMDSNIATWKRAVKEDGLPWIQLMNNQLKTKLDVVKAYHVKAFPTKILIDKNGVIVWKGVGKELPQLELLLKKIFEERH